MTTSDVSRQQVGLIVEDDSLYARALQSSLHKRGYEFEVAGSAAEALSVAGAQEVELAVIDLHLGSQSGLDLIAPLRERHPGVRILLLTGYGTFDTAVEAIKRGANNYLLKPATVDAILQALLADGEMAPTSPPARMTPLARVEWEHIQQALKTSLGNISAAARLLGMHRRSLQRKLARQRRSSELPEEPPLE